MRIERRIVAAAIVEVGQQDEISRACQALAAAFRTPESELRQQLLGLHTFDWGADPHFRGSYSYIPAGALDAPEKMQTSEASTLFFAGEHTDATANWGTVHAALGSGLRAARQVLATL